MSRDRYLSFTKGGTCDKGNTRIRFLSTRYRPRVLISRLCIPIVSAPSKSKLPYLSSIFSIRKLTLPGFPDNSDEFIPIFSGDGRSVAGSVADPRCPSARERQAGSRTSKRLKDARGSRRVEIRAGTRARAIASREDRAARVQATVNASIPILYAKWNGSPGEFARCMRTNERWSYVGAAIEPWSSREKGQRTPRKRVQACASVWKRP